MNKIKKKLNAFVEEGNQIVCVTCYDASFSKILADQKIDIVLVGDSLGMVIQGENNTHKVKMDDILYHVSCVSKNKTNFILMSDMPKNSYEDCKSAYSNAKKLLDNNVDIVKIEYQKEYDEIIKDLVLKSVPVCAHIGLLPQYITKNEDIRIYGKDKLEGKTILQQANHLEKIGVDLILLECVDFELSKNITNSVKIPVIGIGSGEYCDGQVQVLYDLIGISNNPPKFAKDYLINGKNIQGAIKDFHNYVKSIKN